jgi:hypothetical protein
MSSQPTLYAGRHDPLVCGIFFEDSCAACRAEWADFMPQKATEDEQMARRRGPSSAGRWTSLRSRPGCAAGDATAPVNGPVRKA